MHISIGMYTVHDVLVECYMHTVCCTIWPRLNAVEATTCTVVVLVVSVARYLIMVCVVFVISVFIVHSQ